MVTCPFFVCKYKGENLKTGKLKQCRSLHETIIYIEKNQICSTFLNIWSDYTVIVISVDSVLLANYFFILFPNLFYVLCLK